MTPRTRPLHALPATIVALLIGCLISSLGLTVPTSAGARAAQASGCERLAGRRLGGALLLQAGIVSNGTEIRSAFGGTAVTGRNMCRVQGQIRPTPDSDIRFEIWLPDDADWNRNYQAVGGGGNAGSVPLGSMRRALAAGYAVSGQDNGHVGRMDDSSYAVGHPDKVIDFGWRSLHAVALASKAVIAAYYRRAPGLSLFNGCSTGGRQALAVAHRFPRDYDGISAGAPANYWPELNALSAKFGRFLIEHPEAWVSPEKLSMVQNAVLKQCGAINGIIDNPAACSFDVSTLACGRKPNGTCLSDGEIAGLHARFADLVDDRGTLLYPGFSPGLETGLGRSWMGTSREGRWYTSGAARMAEGFFRDYVVGRSDWTIREFDPAADLKAAKNGIIGTAAAAEDPDLSAFADRGGKLIQWHGWHDMAIPARNSIRYHDLVLQRMGPLKVASFYRLFMGTGVDHCGGGPGPDSIGGGSIGQTQDDPDHDVMAALTRWIRTGRAPEQIIASKFADNGKIVAQRPWCAYPAIAQWDGKGDRAKATSYTCPEPG